MTDLDILLELRKLEKLKDFNLLRQPSKDFIEDLKHTKNTLIELECQLNLAIESIEMGIEDCERALYQEQSYIPVALIPVLNDDKELITEKIKLAGILITKFNSYKTYDKVFREVNNMEPSKDDETMQTEGLNNNLDKGEANE